MSTESPPRPLATAFERSEDEITLAEIVAFFGTYWRWIAAGAAAGGLVTLAAAFLMTPVYRAQAVVMPASTDATSSLSGIVSQLGPLGSMVAGLDLGGEGDDRQLWLGTLRSREILRRFVAELDLLPTLFSERWDGSAKHWRIRDGKAWEPTENEALERLQKEVFSVTEERRTGLVTVAVEWRDPELAAQWANRLIDMTNHLLRTRVIEEARRNIAYLEAELEKTNVVERQQIIYRLIESRTREIMLANGRPQYAFIVIDRATPADRDQYVRPKRALMTALGTFTGALLAIAVALGANVWRGQSSTR